MGQCDSPPTLDRTCARALWAGTTSAPFCCPNSADRLVDAEANSRRTSRQAAYCDRPLRRGATAGSGRPLSNQLSPWHFRFTRGRGAGAVERLCIVGAQHELCAHIWNVPTCACDRSFWSATVNDVLIANQDCHGRAANEVQVCRFREIARVSCTEVTRWRPMLRSRESGRTKRTYRSVSSAPRRWCRAAGLNRFGSKPTWWAHRCRGGPCAHPQRQWVSATSGGDVPRKPNTVRRHPLTAKGIGRCVSRFGAAGGGRCSGGK